MQITHKCCNAHLYTLTKQEWKKPVHWLLQFARFQDNHQIALECLAQPRNSDFGEAVTSTIRRSCAKWFVLLACMHVDVLRVILSKYEQDMTEEFRKRLLSRACRTASTEVVQELIDNHQEKFGDWTINDFNYAALHDNIPVLRLLSLPPNGGYTKLAQNPPLNHLCAMEPTQTPTTMPTENSTKIPTQTPTTMPTVTSIRTARATRTAMSPSTDDNVYR